MISTVQIMMSSQLKNESITALIMGSLRCLLP